MDRVYGSLAETNGRAGEIGAGHFDMLFRTMLAGEARIAGENVFQVLTGEPHPLGNMAILRPSVGVEELEEALAGFEGLEFPGAILATGELSDAVRGTLDGAGFALVEEMPAMAIDIDDLRETVLPEGYEFEEVTGGVGEKEWSAVFAEGYGLPFGLADRFSPSVWRRKGLTKETPGIFEFCGRG